MTQPEPRIRLPEAVKAGDEVLVRALITHRMETGLRRDAIGETIPRRIIKRFACLYDDEEVFVAELHEAVAENPYMEFHIDARQSGRLDFLWEEDGGAVYRASRELIVG